jgi:endoglucanase
MLKTKDRIIADEKGKVVTLRSIGIGGWLMMEGYMLGGHNIAEHVFKADIKKLYGQRKLESFMKNFQTSFFNESDVVRIKELGFNCARLPFNYRAIDLELFDKIIGWFRKHKVYLILDLHAAPGSQNCDWHSDSDGIAGLWNSKKDMDATIKIWNTISKRYKNEKFIAGYDILNEPVTKKTAKINELYSRIIKTIRANGDKHILFIEPNMWAQSFDGIKKPKDDNFAWSVHFYLPINYTFNWDPLMEYPGKKYLKKELEAFRKIQLKDKVPVFVGEFGVASRCPHCHFELNWVKDALSIFKGFGWSWSYWTYKSVAGALVPDGLYRTFDHEMFRRESNEPGMENILKILKNNEKGLYKALRTGQFKLHEKLAKLF